METVLLLELQECPVKSIGYEPPLEVAWALIVDPRLPEEAIS